jgi:hypothetical protein
MYRRMTSIGITALCALTAAAVTASGATAGTPVTQGNAAFTCIEGAGAHNTNGDCQPGSTGSFGHKGIAEGVSTGLALDKLNNPVLVTKIGLVTVTLTGKGPVDCIECMAENRTDPGTGVMDVTGTGGRLRFTEVAVSTSNCGVKSVTGDAGVVETEPLKLTTLSPTKATIEPAAGDVVAEFNFTGASCPLTGSNPIKIKGHADGTLNGAVIKFETDTGELTIGTQVAHLNGEATATAGVTGAEYHPVALTAN